MIGTINRGSMKENVKQKIYTSRPIILLTGSLQLTYCQFCFSADCFHRRFLLKQSFKFSFVLKPIQCYQFSDNQCSI